MNLKLLNVFLLCLFLYQSAFSKIEILNLQNQNSLFDQQSDTPVELDSFTKLMNENSGRTQFETLVELFEISTLPSVSSVIGWTSGRWFDKSHPTRALGSVLVVTEYLEGENQGPLFPPKKKNKALIAVDIEKVNPNRFDKITQDDEAHIQGLLKQHLPEFPEIVERNGSLYFNHSPIDLGFETKIYDNYVLVLAKVLKDSEFGKANDVYSACYYFGKL